MKFSDLKNFCLGVSSGLKANQMAPGQFDAMLQLSCDTVAVELMCLKTNQKFASETDTGEYDLNTIVDNFGCLAESGLYYNVGTASAPSYKPLKPITLKGLDELRPNWRDEDSGEPEYFYQEHDTLGVFPAVETGLENAFWLYYAKRAFPVGSDDTKYPFYGDTQNARLSILDYAVALHFKWMSLGILGKNDEYRGCEIAWRREMDRVSGLLKRNLPLQNSKYNKMQGPKVRGGFGN